MKQIMPIVHVPLMLVNVEGGYTVSERPWEEFQLFHDDFYFVDGILPLVAKHWHSQDLNGRMAKKKQQNEDDMAWDNSVRRQFYPLSDTELLMLLVINEACENIERMIKFDPDTIMSLEQALETMKRFAEIVQRVQEPIRQAYPAWQEFFSGNPRYQKHYGLEESGTLS